MSELCNGVPRQLILDTIERLESESDPSYPVGPTFDFLLSRQGVFIQSAIKQIMAQPGYPDNIDWDSVIEDGGLSLLEG
jgi:hypothetical protein